jgi:hypothetical protein
MRRAAVLMMAPVLWLGIASGAVAGGAPIHFDEKQLAPGDTATAMVGTNWRSGRYGTAADGPYFVLMVLAGNVDFPFGDWPWDPEVAPIVGLIEMGDGPVLYEGLQVGPDHIRVAIEVPQVAPGEYSVAVCNPDCSKILGDLLGGRVTVTEGSGGRDPAEVTADVLARYQSQRVAHIRAVEVAADVPGYQNRIPPEFRWDPATNSWPTLVASAPRPAPARPITRPPASPLQDDDAALAELLAEGGQPEPVTRSSSSTTAMLTPENPSKEAWPLFAIVPLLLLIEGLSWHRFPSAGEREIESSREFSRVGSGR